MESLEKVQPRSVAALKDLHGEMVKKYSLSRE